MNLGEQLVRKLRGQATQALIRDLKDRPAQELKERLMQELKAKGVFEPAGIEEAFRNIDRADFMPEEIKALAYVDLAWEIGYGQTISQPFVVAFMLHLLQVKAGDNVLDIGSGSAYTTALLSWLVGIGGKVTALEIILQLKELGEANVANKYSFIENGTAQFFRADGKKGWPPGAPFDKILCSARPDEVPPAWGKQLKVGGRIVVPIKNSIWLLVKESEEQYGGTEYQSFNFVPLV